MKVKGGAPNDASFCHKEALDNALDWYGRNVKGASFAKKTKEGQDSDLTKELKMLEGSLMDALAPLGKGKVVCAPFHPPLLAMHTSPLCSLLCSPCTISVLAICPSAHFWM